MRRSISTRATSSPRRGTLARSDLLELRELLAAAAVGPEARELVGELVVARERRGEDHARVVAQRVRQRPAVRQLGARGRVACSAGRAGCPRRAARRCPRRSASWVSRPSAASRSASTPNSRPRSNAPGARGELDHVRDVGRSPRTVAAVVALDQPRDVLVGDRRGADGRGITSMPCSPWSSRGEVARRRRAARRRAARAPRR